METWIADTVGKMHIHKITQLQVAEKMGVSARYISMILTGVKTPKGARERIEKAIDEIIAEKIEN